jgi:hypothetical protein
MTSRRWPQASSSTSGGSSCHDRARRYQWPRDKDGLGVRKHRGKVAVAGVGHSPVDRRWGGVSMDKTLGAYSILACRKAMDDAGVTPDQIDGVICCDSHIAGGGGCSSQWVPRPYFAPPYDSEWGFTLVNAQWLIAQMRLPNVKFAPTGVPTVSEMVGTAAQAVGDGVATPVSSSTRHAISKAAIVADKDGDDGRQRSSKSAETTMQNVCSGRSARLGGTPALGLDRPTGSGAVMPACSSTPGIGSVDTRVRLGRFQNSSRWFTGQAEHTQVCR